MLVNDLPAAVALTLEDVGEARADGWRGRPRLNRENLGAGADERIGADDLNMTIRNVIVPRLHAVERARPACLDLAVGARRRVGCVDHHRAVCILAHDCVDVAGREAGLRAFRDRLRFAFGHGRMSRRLLEATGQSRKAYQRSREPPHAHAAFCKCLRPSSSAIWTALSAAPLRRLSLTTHRLSPFSTVGSSRIRLT